MSTKPTTQADLLEEFQEAAKEATSASPPSSGLPVMIQNLSTEFGAKLPKALRDRLATYFRLETEVRPRLQHLRSAAAENHRQGEAATLAADIEAYLDAKEGDPVGVDLVTDLESYWAAVVDDLDRRLRATVKARDVIRRDIKAEAAGDFVRKVLPRLWAEHVAVEVTDETPLGEARAKAAQSEAAASLIEGVYFAALDLSKADGPASKVERKLLQGYFEEAVAERSPDMPTIEDAWVETKRRVELRREPNPEEAKRRAEDAEEDRLARRAAARDRAKNLVGPQALANRLGEPVLDTATGEYVHPENTEAPEVSEE